MNLSIIYLETVLVSWIIDKVLALKQIKDITEAGYKINYKKLMEYTNNFKSDNVEAEEKISHYWIPLYNILKAFNDIINFNDQFTKSVEDLYAIGALDELWDIEKEEYQKNPTMWTAWNLSKIVAKRLSNANAIRITVDNYDESYVFFEFTPDGEDIILLKVIGALEDLSVEEQKEIALAFLTEYLSYGVEEFEEEYKIDDEEIYEEKNMSKVNTNYKWDENANNKKEEILVDVELDLKQKNTKKLVKNNKRK